MVVEAGKTSEAALKHALDRIDTGRVTGLLLNKVEATPLEYSYDAYGLGRRRGALPLVLLSDRTLLIYRSPALPSPNYMLTGSLRYRTKQGGATGL